MLPEQAFIGHVNALVLVSDHNARSFLVRLTIPDADGLLMPGIGRRLHLQRAQHSVVVPQDALIRHPDGQFSVFTVQNNIAQRHTVQGAIRAPSGLETSVHYPKMRPW